MGLLVFYVWSLMVVLMLVRHCSLMVFLMLVRHIYRDYIQHCLLVERWK
jgi:hypothetical protein